MRFVIKIFLLITLTFYFQSVYANPANFCTSNEKNEYLSKVEKANLLKSKWIRINEKIKEYPSDIQIKIKSDQRYKTIKNNLDRINETILTYDDKVNKCVLLSKTEKGTEKKIIIEDNAPTSKSTHKDTIERSTDDNGSTIEKVIRTTTTTNKIIRTTTTKLTPYTINTYDNGQKTTIYDDPIITTSEEIIISQTEPVSETISSVIKANKISTKITYETSSNFKDSAPIITTTFVDSDPIYKEVVTDGSKKSVSSVSNGDPIEESSFVDNKSVINNDEGNTITTITRTMTTKTITPIHTRTIVTFVRNIKTYSTIERTTTKKTTIVRTSTKLTTPITTTTWSDGSSTKVKGEVQKQLSTENIVSLSSTKENIEKLISNKDLVITDSDTTTTENKIISSVSKKILSRTILKNQITKNNPKFYHTDEYTYSGRSRLQDPLAIIHADDAYARGFTGKGVKVGILDTGVYCDHYDLDGNMSNKTYNTYYGSGCDPGSGHGTQVAGIIVGEKNNQKIHGVAYDAELHSGKIGEGPAVYFQQYGPSIASQMADNGVIAVNLSANTRLSKNLIKNMDSKQVNGDKILFTDVNWYDSSSINEWKTVTDKGTIIVNSAGNQGQAVPAQPGNYATKVNDSGDLVLNGLMIIVGAPDGYSNKAGHVCHNSIKDKEGNYINCEDKYLTKEFYIMAPGSNITTTDGGGVWSTTIKSGTSFAAPHVTGGLAVLKQAWPQLTPTQLVDLILTTATDMGDPGIDEIYGNGMLNLDESTKPQGEINVSTSSGTSNLSSSKLITTSTIGNSLNQVSSIQSAMVVDSYNRDYETDLTKHIINYDKPLSIDNDFLSFSSLKQLNHKNTKFYIDENNLSNFAFGQKFEKCDIIIGQLKEDRAFLGNYGTGAFAIKNSNTYHSGLSCNYNNFQASYFTGMTSIDGINNSIIRNGKLLSDKWLLEYISDKWLIRMGQPITVINGYMNLDIATSINSDGTHNYSSQKIDTSSDQKHLYSKIQRNFDIKENINLKIGLQFDLNYGNSSSNHAKSEIQFNYNF